MSVGAIGAIGAVGIGSMGAMGFVGQAGALDQGAAVAVLGAANALTKSAAAAQASGLSPSTSVDISAAALSCLAADGQVAGVGASDLAQALILALMLQLLQG